MKVKLIGTGSIYTKYNSASTLINNNLLVDVPNGCLKQMLKMDIDVCNISTILITHMHGDHTADLPFLLQYLNISKINTVTILGPKEIENKIYELTKAYNFLEDKIDVKIKINFIELNDLDDIKINNYNIKAYEVFHGTERPSFGYIIDDKLGITGDSSMCNGVRNIFEKSKCIISDASLIIGDECHMGIDDLKYFAVKYNNPIIATHMRDCTRENLRIQNLNTIKVVEDGYEFEL